MRLMKKSSTKIWKGQNYEQQTYEQVLLQPPLYGDGEEPQQKKTNPNPLGERIRSERRSGRP